MMLDASNAGSVHSYNGDLGLAAGSAEAIRTRFADRPWLIEMLIDEELNSVFLRYEDGAKGKKRQLRRWGALTLAVAGIGLIGAGVELALRSLDVNGRAVDHLGGISSSLSFLATVAAIWLIWVRKTRKQWLENRFAAERLRQWHFQTLLDGPLCALAMRDVAAFKAERRLRFTRFVGGELSQLSGTMQTWLSDPQRDEEMLHAGIGKSTGGPDPELWEAYRWLRLEHQQRHWGAKLSRDETLAGAEALMRGAGHTCLQLAVFVMVVQVVLYAISLAMPAVSALESGSIVASAVSLLLVVLSVVFRAMDEGLGFSREAEHYAKMSLVYIGILGRTHGAVDAQAQAEIMQSVEQWAMTELKDFLFIHAHAKFLL